MARAAGFICLGLHRDVMPRETSRSNAFYSSRGARSRVAKLRRRYALKFTRRLFLVDRLSQAILRLPPPPRGIICTRTERDSPLVPRENLECRCINSDRAKRYYISLYIKHVHASVFAYLTSYVVAFFHGREIFHTQTVARDRF